MINENQKAGKFIVSILGSKGGSGKTTTSHMVGNGLGLLRHGCTVAVTDHKRIQLDKEGRRYNTFNGTSRDTFIELLSRFRAAEPKLTSILVLDGGASRAEGDAAFIKLSDLTLLPFKANAEDLRVILNDLNQLQNTLTTEEFGLIRLLPADFPSNKWHAERAQKLVDGMLSSLLDIVLDPVESIAASELLLQDRIPAAGLPSNLNSACRRLAAEVLIQLEQDPYRYLPTGKCLAK